MKIGLISLFVILFTSCGKEKSGSRSTSQTNSNSHSECFSFKFYQNDSPASIAAKSFRMKEECKLQSETDLVNRLKEF